MAELTISAAVGAPPSPNRPDDVRTIQGLLQKVAPPLAAKINVTGKIDPVTSQAIVEFQKRFMQQPDGRVDPDGRTLMHLNDGFVSNYPGCDAAQRRKIDDDIILARRWLDTVNRRLVAANDADLETKVRDVFSIDPANRNHSGYLATLRGNYTKLRSSMDQKLTFKCEKIRSVNAAWVDPRQPTFVFLAINHFAVAGIKRVAKLIHERSHIVLNTHHSGMAPGGEINFGEAPHETKGFKISDALDNAYCYEYLAISLQVDYNPNIWR
jgi:hypothetical protein